MSLFPFTKNHRSYKGNNRSYSYRQGGLQKMIFLSRTQRVQNIVNIKPKLKTGKPQLPNRCT